MPEPNRSSLRIIQITDCHLFASKQAQLVGLTTQVSFDAVLSQIKQDKIEADLILVTGDLSQDGSDAAYQRCFKALAEFAVPQIWIPGNHDQRAPMERLAASAMVSVKQFAHWQIVALDSHIEGKVPGYLGAKELSILKASLKQHPEKFTLVTCHHPPIKIGSAWLDSQRLKNGDELLKIMTSHTKETVLLWGHIHQQWDEQRDHLRLLATPSTCFQFLPKSADYCLDTLAPGYRYLELHADGRVDTHVRRLDHFQFTPDYSVKGY